MALTTLTSFGVAGYAESENQVVYYEENLYDFNDNVTYLLRYKNDGGYSIIHQESGVVCEYDEFNVSPYNGEIGKLYYGGPGVYLSMPSKLVGKISPMQYFGITQEENASLEAINSTFIEQAQSMETFTITSNDGYTLINNYGAFLNYDNIPNTIQGVQSCCLLLKFFNDYFGGNCVQNGVDAITFYCDVEYYFDNSATGNLQICQALKNCMINYMNAHTPNSNISVTYTIISPRSDIISRIGVNKPSIVVMTNSYSDSKCNIVYGYSGNFYRIYTASMISVNINRSYVYGGVFLG